MSELKEGDRVQLMEEMDELTAGLVGTVQKKVVHFDYERGCYSDRPISMLVVHFDGRSFPSQAREINGQWVFVVSKCKLICQ